MNYDHKTPWELIDYMADAGAGYWRTTAEDYEKQRTLIQRWNQNYSNAMMANSETIRWATEMIRFIKYPNTDDLSWGRLQAELAWLSLEGVAGTTGALRPSMLLSTALICYTDLYKNLNTQKTCLDAMLSLRRIGLDIQWSQNGITEDHNMFQVPSRTSRRAVFGKGAIPMLRRVAPVLRQCRQALLPLDPQETTPEDWLNVAEEVAFQLNIFAEQNNFNWKAVLRVDWEELWRSL